MLERLDQWLLLAAQQFNWRQPLWLYLLPLPLLALLPRPRRGSFSHSLRARLTRFIKPRMWPLVLRGEDAGIEEEVSGRLPWVALILVILALAGPRWTHENETISRQGSDIAVVMDISRSMWARDVKPDRLSREKQELHDFLERLNGDRVALVAFAGRAFTVVPLTTDYGAVIRFAAQLAPEYVTAQGSNLARGLEAAARALSSARGRGRAVVLLTDGEDYPRGEALTAARHLAAAHIPLFILGIGTGKGGLIPTPRGTFVHDSSGHAVLSRLQEDHLKALTQAAGGMYVRMRWDDDDWSTLYKELRKSVTQTRTAARARARWREDYAWALLPAMLLGGWWWRQRMRRWRS